MNAYELADEFDWMTEEKIVQWCNDVVNMLRQQADRIAELEKSSMAWYEAGKFVSPQIKELSDEEYADACLSYRHDFGLLDEEQRKFLMFQAKEWHKALKKASEK